MLEDHPLGHRKDKVNVRSIAKAECKLQKFMKLFLLTE